MHPTDRTSRRSLVRSFLASVAAAGAGLFGVARAQQPEAAPGKRTSTDDQPPGDKPPLFSGWVTYGNLVFVAGKGEHTPGDIRAHTTSVLNQIEAELTKVGSSMAKVLKVNVYLHDIKDYDGMNEVFRGRFGPNPPVRTTIACYGGIPGSSLVEIDCIAAR
ncbi:MAG TPA: RidA family protein [Vicinamibacterales bacterium]|nr:RidA family protein [Vicinamibacterales bacterium]